MSEPFLGLHKPPRAPPFAHSGFWFCFDFSVWCTAPLVSRIFSPIKHDLFLLLLMTELPINRSSFAPSSRPPNLCVSLGRLGPLSLPRVTECRSHPPGNDSGSFALRRHQLLVLAPSWTLVFEGGTSACDLGPLCPAAPVPC